MTVMTGVETINKVNEKFMDAFKRRDAAAVARCYTANAAVLPPQSDLIAGTKAIEEFWTAGMKAGLTDVSLTTAEFFESADVAYEVGRYTLFAGEKVADRGKYIVIWRREAGEWKLHRDIWNTNVA